MKTGIFVIVLLVLVIPFAIAQEINIAEKANQKSITVTINEMGDIRVSHVVVPSNSLKQVELIDGTIQNLIITNEEGKEKTATIVGNNDAVIILPSGDDLTIEYDLEDVLFLKDNLWTMDFLYLETTTFMIPEKLELVFVNDRPVYLNEKKGFVCHGCQMTLQYAFDEPKNIIEVKWEDKEFLVEMRTFADIDNFEFDQPAKEISFNVNDDNQFITAIIPLELLWEPYMIFDDDDEKEYFQNSMNNGTHVWINMKPDTVGEIRIVGTTVIPEFPIIAPLAIGFLVIMTIPLIRKFNLR